VIGGYSADQVAHYQNMAKNLGEETCVSCKKLSFDLNGQRVDNAHLKNDNEVLRDRVAELSAHLSTATGATVDVRQAEFIRRLQEIDRSQRSSMHWLQKDLAALTEERDDLRKLLAKHDIDLRGVKEHTVKGLVTVNWAADVETEAVDDIT
jgi:hypothetical protein